MLQNEFLQLSFLTLIPITLCRLVHVKMIAHVAASVGLADTVSNLLPLLEPLSEDIEPAIKQQLLQQMNGLAKFCEKSGEEGYLAIIHHIMSVFARDRRCRRCNDLGVGAGQVEGSGIKDSTRSSGQVVLSAELFTEEDHKGHG